MNRNTVIESIISYAKPKIVYGVFYSNLLNIYSSLDKAIIGLLNYSNTTKYYNMNIAELCIDDIKNTNTVYKFKFQSNEYRLIKFTKVNMNIFYQSGNMTTLNIDGTYFGFVQKEEIVWIPPKDLIIDKSIFIEPQTPINGQVLTAVGGNGAVWSTVQPYIRG
jgi:hypothetical protein